MKIVSFGPKDQEKPGALYKNQVIDLTAVDPSLPSTVRGMIEAGVFPKAERILVNAASLDPKYLVPLTGIRLGPPVTNPSKIICLGLNYRDHAEEQDRAVPEWPLTFAKAPSVLTGDGDPIPIPEDVSKVDHEVELAFVIAKRAKDVSIENAPAYDKS